MTEEKYKKYKERIIDSIYEITGPNGVSLTMMYNDRYFLLNNILLELSVVADPIIEGHDDDYINIDNKWYSLTTLQQVDKETESLLRMIKS